MPKIIYHEIFCVCNAYKYRALVQLWKIKSYLLQCQGNTIHSFIHSNNHHFLFIWIIFNKIHINFFGVMLIRLLLLFPSSSIYSLSLSGEGRGGGGGDCMSIFFPFLFHLQTIIIIAVDMRINLPSLPIFFSLFSFEVAYACFIFLG